MTVILILPPYFTQRAQRGSSIIPEPRICERVGIIIFESPAVKLPIEAGKTNESTGESAGFRRGVGAGFRGSRRLLHTEESLNCGEKAGGFVVLQAGKLPGCRQRLPAFGNNVT